MQFSEKEKNENIITSYCPQIAPEVAFRLLEMLTDKGTTDNIRHMMGYL